MGDDNVAEPVPAPATYELRHRILGRGRTPEEVRTPDDEHPDSGHYAIRRDGAVIATGTVRRRATPSGEAPAWQIRGMATEPDLRRSGFGSAVLAALIEHTEAQGGGVIWCHARIAARTLYERHGFVVEGEPFEDAIAGTQIYMHRRTAT